MNRRDRAEFDELEELLWQAETPEEEDEDFSLDDLDFLDEEEEEPEVYRNYANGYGEDDYDNEDEDDFSLEEYAELCDEPDLDTVYSDTHRRAAPRRSASRKARKKRRRRGCCGCLTLPFGFLVVVILGLCLLIQPPKTSEPIGARKSNTATILVCGTDEDGTRTDTMMLLYLSGSENKAGLLSLPRDSYTISSTGSVMKLNAIYGRGGCGEEGMEALMDQVAEIIGYRPDGYILLDFTLVAQIVDTMGGVYMDVPMDMEVASVALEKGYQHLSGKQLMTLLRFRKGYATADLGRVEMQRSVIKACMEQWLTPSHISSATKALSLLESSSCSSLRGEHYIWLAKTLLPSMKNLESDTLPGYADYRNNASYYILNKTEIAELINESYNPYKEAIDADDLKIAG